MKTLSYDIDYLCSKMSDMSGLPIRIYENDQLKNRFSALPFIADPAVPYLNTLLSKQEHVSYYLTEKNDCYGIIRCDEMAIIIGPARNAPFSNQELHDLAFELNITNKDYEDFAAFMNAIVPLPLESLIQMMCSINHILSQEKLNLSDFQLKESTKTVQIEYDQPSNSADAYKSYNIEKQILDIIRSGDISFLEQWSRQAPSVRSGILSDNLLRQRKNTFIVTTTLAARAAIESGMKVDEAFQMSDSFIQRCENCFNLDELNYLQFEMISAYTKEVGKLKNMTNENRISKDVYYYILQHISDPIRTEDIAKAVYMSRSHLSTLFKKETGISLNDYIHQIKIAKARELLSDSSKSITLISDYLGYSSSSHFTRVFIQITGTTPKQYRKRTI